MKLTRRDFGKVSTDYKIIHFLKQVEHSFARAHYGWREIFSDEELLSLLRPELRSALKENHPAQQFQAYDDEVAGCHIIDRASYIDIKTWLVDDILVKADRMTMAHALEGRAPFLDYRLVEFAASLPVHLKLAGTKKKYLLKKSQTPRLPQETLFRKKAGFNAPIAQWLLGPLKGRVEALAESSPLLEYIERDALRALIHRHTNHLEDASFKLFSLLCLHEWMMRKEKQASIHLRAAS
jgi:asparagine synthase (glutamine-hydrolysing)